MNNAELIKALRHCGKGGDIAERCLPCGYYDQEPWCESALVNDAADALEAAEKRIAELMPKEGEWQQHIFDGIMGKRPTAWVCTMCNCLSVYKTDYCPNCGAKMKGANDGEEQD